MTKRMLEVGIWIATAALSAFTAAAAESGDDERVADLIVEAEAATDEGRLRDAEQLLRSHLGEQANPVVGPLAVEMEIIRRIRLDHSLTPDTLLPKLQSSLPDVTPSDVRRWHEQGHLQHRRIDGQVRYFNRAASNLFRFCDEARARRKETDRPKPAGWTFSLPDHLSRIVQLAEEGGTPMVYPVKHYVTYRLAVNDNHPRVKAGATVRCWLPFPQEYRQQKEVRLVSSLPKDAVVAPAGQPHRSIYFEQTITDPAKPLVFEATFEFVTSAYCPDLDPAAVEPYDLDSPLYREYTAERPPHVVFTPEIRQIAEKIAAEQPNLLRRARELFRWECENIRYCSEMEYSTIRNLSQKAMMVRQGDCGVQGMLYIALCRAAGIPARWQSGWESKPNAWNMHDWAEFYIEPWGWLPADPSYGIQEHDDPRVRDFYCGNIDPYRLIVNLDYGRALTPEKTSFRSEPNDFQRGEIEIDGHNLYFDEWSWTLDLRTVPRSGDSVALEEAFDAVVPNLLTQGKMAGAVILVGKKGTDGYDVWQKAYGYQQTAPHPRPMRSDAIFDMASLSKPIATGTSLMILVEQGKIGLDDRVGKYLPEFRSEDKKEVTIRHLMTHTSGEKPYVGAAEQKKIVADAGFPCRKAVRTYIRGLPLLRSPGEAVQYSCLNAILCAEVIRAVSHTEHSDFAAEHVFRPLGMVDTGFGAVDSSDTRLVPTTMSNHGKGIGGFLAGQVHDPLAAMQEGISGNAGLFSTAADLSRFAQMMLDRGERNGIRILKPETIDQMTRVQNRGVKNTKGVHDRRGLLWDIYRPEPTDRRAHFLDAYGHTGYTGTAIRIYPARGIYVIALANRVHPDDTGKVARFRDVVWRTVAEMFGE